LNRCGDCVFDSDMCVFVTLVLFFTDSIMSATEHAHYRIELIVKCAQINKAASVISFSYEICQMLVRVYSHIFNKSAILPLVHWAVEFPLTLQECGKSTLRLIYDYSTKYEMS